MVLDALLGIAVALLLALAGLGAGRPLAQRAGDTPLVQVTCCLGAGLALLGYAIFGLGLLGALQPLVLGLLLGGAACGCRPALRLLPAAGRELGGPLLAWIGLLALTALAPNPHFDVQVYHYALPELYARHHSLAWTWANLYEGLLGPVHMLYVAALSLGGETAANLLGPLYVLLLCGGILDVCQELSPEGGRRAAWLLVASPVVVMEAQGGLVDLPCAAYCSLALAAAARGQRGRVVLWGGVAMAVKWLAGLNVLWLAFFPAGRRAVLLGLLLLAPFLLRNALVTGDPISPVWKTWRLGQSGGLTASAAAPQAAPPSSWDRFPFTLVQLSHRGWQSVPHPLIWLASLWALRRRGGSCPPLARGVVASWMVLLLLRPSQARYLLPTLPAWTCLAAPVLASVPDWLLFLTALPGALVLAALLWVRLPVLTRGPEEYLRARTPYAAYQYLATHARPEERVYLVGRLGFRCPLDYTAGDSWPRRRPQPPLDYYVVDLREEPILRALVAALGEGPWTPEQLKVGPLAVLSETERADLAARWRQVRRPRRSLNLQQVLRARPVYVCDKVVVLQP